MKIFIGPTGYNLKIQVSDIEIKPPAQQGDIAAEAIKKPDTLVLIDGYFTQHLAPWHKEILLAIEMGCRVIGAGSLGALRAIECDRYGMESAGKIAEWFRQEVCYDDSEVALAHACEEDGYTPLSVPLVNIRATCEYLGLDTELIVDQCREIFYMDRSWGAIKSKLGNMANHLKEHYVNQKKLDAIEAIKKARNPHIQKSHKASNIMTKNFVSMLLNDVPKDGKRPWELAIHRKEAVDSWLLSELAMAVGISASEHEILSASHAMWKAQGVHTEEDANKWLQKHNITDSQWNTFAMRDAVRKNARNWLDSASGSCDIVPITNEFQLFNNLK